MQTLYYRPVSFFFFFFSSSNLSGRRLDVYRTSTVYTWCGPSANLECRSEMCCMWLTGNAEHKNSHLGTITQFCRAVSLQLRHISTIGKKLVKQQYLLHMSSEYGKLRPTNILRSVGEFGAPQQISTDFASWQCYCTAL